MSVWITGLWFKPQEGLSHTKNSKTVNVIINVLKVIILLTICPKLFNIESFTFVHLSEMEDNSARS